MALTFDLYSPGDSFLYRMDPRTKLLGVGFIFGVSVLFTHPIFLVPLFFGIILLNIIGKVPLKKVGILLKGLSVLALISMIMWPLLFHPGEKLFDVLGIPITDLGIFYGLGMAFRILNMVIGPISLMLTTRQKDLILGLRGLGLPYRGSFALATAFRFVPTVVGVGNGITEAQRSRGFDVSKGNVIKRMRNYIALMGPLMISSLRIAQQLALAVEAKGMSSTAKRTTVRPLVFSSMDRIVLVLFGVLVAGVITVRILGYGIIEV